MLMEMVLLKESIFKLQKAFVTERAELIDNNRKKWDTSMLQRRDKEVMVESIHTFPITTMLVGNHSSPAMSLHTVIWLHLSHCINSEKDRGWIARKWFARECRHIPSLHFSSPKK